MNVGRQDTAPTVRLISAREIELICVCGLTLRQSIRAPIEERCPRCWRRWRR